VKNHTITFIQNKKRITEETEEITEEEVNEVKIGFSNGFSGNTWRDQTVADCPAEVIFQGANYDSKILAPDFFKKYIVPHLKKQSEILHQKDKYLLSHTDGENSGLLELYLESNFDIADSVCPFPMTEMTLKGIKSILKDKITIWGHIFSVCIRRFNE
jgi:hypothetical protein